MSEKVYVSVKGTTFIEGQKDTTELVTEGEMSYRNGKYLLKYKEALSDDGCEASSLIKIDKDLITMTRTGGVNTQMIFECGKKHTSHYETPVGSFTIGIITNRLKSEVAENGGVIAIEYVLDINNASVVENHLEINIHKEIAQ